jgi:hypothetical protein
VPAECRHVIHRLIPDASSGEPHVLKGRFREIVVE